jgi:hypothetical protein
MPLDKSPLANGLRDMFEGKPEFASSESDAAQTISDLYRQYAGNAVAGPTSPLSVSLTGAGTALSQALKGAFTAAKSAGPAGVTALGVALDSAFVAFWLAPPVAFATPPTGPPTIAGLVTVAPPGILAPGLTALFTSGVAQKASAGDQADALAALLDAWTRTVFVVNTPVTPPGSPSPPAPLA